jgi:taurine dioxygenase
MTAVDYRHIAVRPINPNIGAFIEGVDVSVPREPEVYDEIRQALWRHHVVFFRDQAMTPAAHEALAAAFGDAVPHEIFPSVDSHPSISILENDREHPPEVNVWHTDVTFRERPILASVLHGVILPPSGGDTMWASQAAVFDGLAAPIQNMLMDLEAEHDVLHAFAQTDFLQRAGGEEKAAELRRTSPARNHPVVITHPVTGRPGIFVSRAFTRRIVGVSKRESDAILEMLFDLVETPEYQVRFTWEPNSIAIWDNFATQHYAVADYWPHHRLMQRITVGTAKPTAARHPLPLAAE